MTAQTQPPLPTALTGAHQQVAESLQLLQRLESTLDDAVHQIGNETYTGTDEDRTVEASITGEHVLTALHIEDGLLRLGADTVEQRVNEALHNAEAAASEAVNGQCQQVFASLAETTINLKTALGLDSE